MNQDPFFKLQGTCDEIESQEKLSTILRNGKGFHNGIYTPDTWEFSKGKTPFLKKLHFENCSFSKTTIRGLDFVSCKFINCHFIGTYFDECEFHDCEFVGCNFFKAKLDNCYLDPNSIKGISKIKHSNIALRLYSELIKNAKQIDSSNFQSDAEFYYKVYQRYQKLFKLKPDENEKRLSFKWGYKLIKFIASFVGDFIWMLISGYGMRSRYVVFSGISFICILTCINYQFGTLIDGISNNTDEFARGVDSLYFSVMTITTLGYGSVTPTNPEGKLWVAFQAITGVVWLTACASVIVKKIVRSS